MSETPGPLEEEERAARYEAQRQLRIQEKHREILRKLEAEADLAQYHLERADRQALARLRRRGTAPR